jgi:hypothetical protein
MAKPQEERPRRWARIVDVLEDASLYTEDAERLRLAGVRLPSDAGERAEALHLLAELVHDKIVFFHVVREGGRGALEAEVWVQETHVNDALRQRGYQ